MIFLPAIPDIQPQHPRHMEEQHMRQKIEGDAFPLFFTQCPDSLATLPMVTFYINTIFWEADSMCWVPVFENRMINNERQRWSDPVTSFLRPEVEVLIQKLPKTAISVTIMCIRKILDNCRWKTAKFPAEAETIIKFPNTKGRWVWFLFFSALKKTQKWPNMQHW